MELSTSQEFLLLAHHPQKGRFLISDTNLNYGIIGALLLEMSQENRIVIEDGRLILKNIKESNNQAISEISTLISGSAKSARTRVWIVRLEKKSIRYKWIILKELEKKGVIRIEWRRLLGIIPYRKSYLTESLTREKLIQQLKNKILFHQEISHELVGIMGLIEACRMHRVITNDRDEVKVLRKELKKIMKESPIADLTNKIIREVESEIFAAVAASTFAANAANDAATAASIAAANQ